MSSSSLLTIKQFKQLAGKMQSNAKSSSSRTTTTTIAGTSSSSSLSLSSNESQLEGIFHLCDAENRNNLDRKQLDEALSLIGIRPSKRNDIIKSMISSSSSLLLLSSSNKAKKRLSFSSEEIKLEPFLAKTLPEVDNIKTDEFDILLSFVKSGIDNKTKYIGDESITVDELRHLLTSQSMSCLSTSEVDELLSIINTNGKIKWKDIVDTLCWKKSIS